MPVTTDTLTQIEHKQTNGGKAFTSCEIGGWWYYCWTSGMIKDAWRGQAVTIEYAEKDKDGKTFKNITAAHLADTQPQGAGNGRAALPAGGSEATPPRHSGNGAPDPTRASIERQTALKVAGEVAVAMIAAGKPCSMRTLLELAGHAAKFLATGRVNGGANAPPPAPPPAPVPAAPNTDAGGPDDYSCDEIPF